VTPEKLAQYSIGPRGLRLDGPDDAGLRRAARL